jgi:hypothetical protein
VNVLLNQKQWFFEDTQTYNSFIRLRRDQITKLSSPNQVFVELDFYHYLEFKKTFDKQTPKEADKDAEDSLFTLNERKEGDSKDAVEAYVKKVIN